MQVQLTFSNKEQLSGIAKDTAYNKEREECLIITTERGDVSVVLEELSSISAIEENPHFDIVYFEKT